MATDAGFEGPGPAWAGPAAGGRDAGGHDDSGAESRGRTAPDPRKLAQDWVTLWQSELSAMAADPELRETWQSFMAVWAGTMAAMIRGLPRSPGNDRSGGYTGAADAPRAAPAAAAPDARDAEIERLARHVAILERRLADLERGDSSVHPKRNTGRKPRK